jgi:hypothetical protein
MKREAVLSLSIAVASLVFLSPQLSQAKDKSSSQVSQSAAKHEAMLMVPAQASLAKDIDARKMQPGHEFRATLKENVRLKNGPDLPRGTVLIGTIATDSMQRGGVVSLALRFTKAELKSGKVIPIKATIMGIAPPVYDSYEDASGLNLGSWNRRTLQLDQIGALSGVDLHSKISSKNSGVFVSSKKDDVRLSRGSEMSLAIAPNNG